MDDDKIVKVPTPQPPVLARSVGARLRQVRARLRQVWKRIQIKLAYSSSPIRQALVMWFGASISLFGAAVVAAGLTAPISEAKILYGVLLILGGGLVPKDGPWWVMRKQFRDKRRMELEKAAVDSYIDTNLAILLDRFEKRRLDARTVELVYEMSEVPEARQYALAVSLGFIVRDYSSAHTSDLLHYVRRMMSKEYDLTIVCDAVVKLMIDRSSQPPSSYGTTLNELISFLSYELRNRLRGSVRISASTLRACAALVDHNDFSRKIEMRQTLMEYKEMLVAAKLLTHKESDNP